MLLDAGADFRVKNDSGRGLAAYTQQHQRYLVSRAKRWLEEFPDADWIRFDPYHLEVATFLEQEGLLPEGTHAEWKREFDQLIERHDSVAYEDRDPFVDEWVQDGEPYSNRRMEIRRLRMQRLHDRKGE